MQLNPVQERKIDASSRYVITSLLATEYQISVKCLESVEQRAALALTLDKLKRLQKAIKLGDSLKILQETIVNGWPEKNMLDERLLPYYGLRSELVIDDDLIFKGHQLVMPRSTRGEMLECSHKAHVGIEACLRRMKETIYRPGMAADMKKFVSNCDVCQKFGNKQQNQPIIQHDVGDYPWSKVGLDLCNLQGHLCQLLLWIH